MKLTVEQPNLVHVLMNATSIVERRNTIPIMANVLLSARDGTLKVTATDSDIEITAPTQANIEVEGETTVNAEVFLNFIKKLAKGKLVELELKDHRLNIKSGKSKSSLATLDASSFPKMATTEYENNLIISSSDLYKVLGRTSFAMSTEETRYYLNGVYMHNLDNSIVGVATDGHRLAKSEIDNNGIVSDIIIPRKTVVELKKLLSDVGEVSLQTSETKMRVSCGEFSLVSKVVDGTYPDYTKIIPTKGERIVNVDAKEFSAAINRVVTVSDERTKSVKLEVSSGKIEVSVNSQTGEARDEIEIDYSGESFVSGFNSKYLNEVAAQAENGSLEVSFGKSSDHPALITPDAHEGALYLVMGMRV